MIKLDFSANHESRIKSILMCNLPAVAATLDFYNFAKKNHVAVFLLSARKDHLTNLTIKNLHDAGYSNWDGLYLRPASYKQKSFLNFKINHRKALVNNGYDIVVNLGDQDSDLNGGYAEKIFRLPNPCHHSVN